MATALKLDDLTLDDFALVARIAAVGKLSAVARERDVPPSQVSRALARVEAACGVRLLHRSTHGLSLTPEGDAFVARSADLRASADALGAELAERSGEPSGLVRVAISPVMAHYLLPSLGTLLARYPRLSLDLRADDRITDMARDGIDLAIRTGEPSADGLVARRLGNHDRACFAAPAYLRERGTPAHPAELNGTAHRLIANSASPVLNRWAFVDTSVADGDSIEVRPMSQPHSLRTDNTAVILAMTLQGLGIGRINTAIAAPHEARGELVRLLEPFRTPLDNPIYAAMLPERQRLPKIRACIEHWAAWFAGDGMIAR